MTPNLFTPSKPPSAPAPAVPSKLVPARSARFPTTCPGCAASVSKGAPYWYAPQGETNAKAWCVSCGERMTGKPHGAAHAETDPRDGHPADVPTQPQGRTLPPPPAAPDTRTQPAPLPAHAPAEAHAAYDAARAQHAAQESAQDAEPEPDWNDAPERNGQHAQDPLALRDHQRAQGAESDPLALAIARAVEPMLSRAAAASLDVDAARALARAEARAELASALRRLRRSGAADDLPAPVTWTPKPSSDYDPDTTTGRALRACIESCSHAFVSGPSGSGKTFPALQEAAALGRPVVYLSCSDGMDRASLLGSWILERPRKGQGTAPAMRWEYGPLPRAMASGAVLALDEIDKLTPALAALLFGVTDPYDPQPLYVPENGATIAPAPGFVVICTGNTLRDESGLYSGQRPDAALVGRMLHVAADYLPGKVEARIIARHARSQAAADKIAAALQTLRQLHARGQCDTPPSLRTGLTVARLMAGTMPSGAPAPAALDWSDAWTLALLGSLAPSQHAAAVQAIGSGA